MDSPRNEGLVRSTRPQLRGSGSYPTMIRMRTANRKITRRSESVTLTQPSGVGLGGDGSPTGASPSSFDSKHRSTSKKRKRTVYSKASRRKSLENLGLLVRNRCGTAKLQWPSDRKETDAFALLPEGCLKIRQLRLSSPKPGCACANKGGEAYCDKDELIDDVPKVSLETTLLSHAETMKHVNNVDDNDNHHRPRNGIDWKSRRNISVIVRIRPKQGREMDEKAIIFRTDSNTIVFDPKEKTKDFYFQGVKQLTRNDFGRKRPNRNVSFTYDKVYGPETSNREIFNDSLGDLTEHLMEGYNCTVFAYGATGSGKTYTMIGSNSNPGLTVLMVESLYKRVGALALDYDCDIVVSYLEVYNETIKDLLRPEKELSIREDGKKGIIIPELSFYKPRGPVELLKLLRSGNRARTQHATDLNSESSRSHAVFEVKVCLKRKHLVPKDPLQSQDGSGDAPNSTAAAPADGGINKVEVIHSKLVMVDLAGSERNAGNLDGARQREGASINKSLLALANCISALADGKCHIPYRNSKLTRLLKDALSGNCTTVMIANISPSAITSEDTYNTLKYADRAKSIVGPGSKQNVFLEDLIEDSVKSQVAELQAKVVQLSELLEEEKLKHELMASSAQLLLSSSTRRGNDEVGNSDRGDGDGLHAERRNNKQPASSSYCHSCHVKRMSSSLDSAKLPSEIRTYIELASERGQLFSSYVEQSGTRKMDEWAFLCKKLKADMADYFGRLEVSDENYVTFSKLKNELVNNNTVEENGYLAGSGQPTRYALEMRNLTEKMERKWGEYVNNNLSEETYKVDASSSSFSHPPPQGSAQSQSSCLCSDSVEPEPKVEITLQEFLLFKLMVSEMDGERRKEQFYNAFSQQINNQLITSGMTLMHSLKLVKTMYSQLSSTKSMSAPIQNEYKQLLGLVYGMGATLEEETFSGKGGSDNENLASLSPKSQSLPPLLPSSNLGRRSSLVSDDLNNLRKLVERPLLVIQTSSEKNPGDINEDEDDFELGDENEEENYLNEDNIFSDNPEEEFFSQGIPCPTECGTEKSREHIYEPPLTRASSAGVSSSGEMLGCTHNYRENIECEPETVPINGRDEEEQEEEEEVLSQVETSLTADETSSKESLLNVSLIPEAEFTPTPTWTYGVTSTAGPRLCRESSSSTESISLCNVAASAPGQFQLDEEQQYGTRTAESLRSKKGTAFEIRFVDEKKAASTTTQSRSCCSGSKTSIICGGGSRSSNAQLKSNKAKSNSQSGEASSATPSHTSLAARACGGDGGPHLVKQKVSSETFNDYCTSSATTSISTSASTSAENVKSQGSTQRKSTSTGQQQQQRFNDRHLTYRIE